jgi:hypothetical protein
MAKKHRKPRQPVPAEYGFGVFRHVISTTSDTSPEPPPARDDSRKDPAAVSLELLQAASTH